MRERRFTADASHELRTPLGILKAELELALRRGRSPEELRAALESAAEETERLVRLAEDLLVIARLDRGELPARRDEIEVAQLLGTVGARYGPRLHAAGMTLCVEGGEGLRVSGDELQLEQAIGNLLENALRHGAGEVRLSAAPHGNGVRASRPRRGSRLRPGLHRARLRALRPRGRRPLARRRRTRPGDRCGGGRLARRPRRGPNRAGGGADVWLELPGAPVRRTAAPEPVSLP